MPRRVVIADGIRSPFVRASADLREVPPWALGAAVSRELLARTAVPPARIDEVIFGCVAQPSDTANIARVIALRSGIPRHVPAFTVGRNCGSGMEALALAYEKISCGSARCVLAGGVESMSTIPLHYPLSFGWKLAGLVRARSLPERLLALSIFRPRDFKPRVALEEGLTDPVCGEIMGLTAERLAREFGISRAEQDAYALRSHQRAVAARAVHREEIAPFAVPPRLDPRVLEDIGPRPTQTLEALARLRPYFDKRLGTVTIGNSCQITDGAVALLVMDEDLAREMELTPLGAILGHAVRGCDPARMGLGPVYATPAALAHAGVAPEALRRIELNEAFAAQVLACRAAFASPTWARDIGLERPFELDDARLNVNGGAIALGHPVGATGARLVLTLLHELRRVGGGPGLATLCIGGGQGAAMVVEGRAA